MENEQRRSFDLWNYFPKWSERLFLCSKNLVSSVHGILNDYLGFKKWGKRF